ncbi:hypothetical protein F5X68DRAFT_228929 [Plectosphaerella plurivora]|uniref:Uncharacterized protein n=1 Tax=Plectosphaerella plurivora TaxID=936078 RepID=A0A9P9AG15_9PEZI|nr:hypothetical protein F5X68DRAFT_228929 [Plectosphaerella plurivora]
MSTTATQTVASRVILADYAIHHSGNSRDIKQKEPVEQSQEPVADSHWNLPHRRVPAYRPVDTNRDQSQIRVYNNPIERMFIFTMFTGVFINATAAKIWRSSFGRLNENLVRYKVGGEI